MKKEENQAADFLKKSIGDLELIKAAEISDEKDSTLKDEDTLLDALELSRENPKEAIVILGFQGVVGTLDKLEIISKITRENVSILDKIKLKDVMNKKFISCSSKDDFKKIYETIIETKLEAIVLEKDYKFVKLLDYFDLIKFFKDTKFKIENPPIINKAINKKINKIDAESNLFELKGNFIKNKSNYCLVYKDEKAVGLVTIKDLLGPIYKNLDLENVEVQNIMSARMVFLEQGKDLNEAMRLASEKRFNQIPIKEGEKIIGILGIKEAVKLYYDFLKSLKEGDYDVEELE